MLLAERSEFDMQIRIVFAAFGRLAKSDHLEAYWLGLQDAKLSEVARRVEQICKTATKRKAVPLPAELRKALPEREIPQENPQHQTESATALRLNSETWSELEKADPELFGVEIGIARAGRILAADRPSSPAYAEALTQDRQLRDQRLALWRKRAGLQP